MPQARRITAADVARRAGVSTATVSYVLNDTPGQVISPATRERVFDAVKQLNYVQNPAARALAHGGSRFVIIDMSLFPRGDIAVEGIDMFLQVVADAGYTPIVTWWGPHGWEERLVQLVQETSPYAVITATPVSEPTLDQLKASGARSMSSLFSSVEDLFTPLRQGTETQVEYLVQQGHKHLLFVPESDPALEQLSHWRAAAGESKAHSLGATWAVADASHNAPEHQENLRRALDVHPEVTAIAAYNDDVAVFVLSALHRLGIKIPQDIAVIGIDNLPFTEATYPALTTVNYEYRLNEFSPEAIRTWLEGEGQYGLLGPIDEVARATPVHRESA